MSAARSAIACLEVVCPLFGSWPFRCKITKPPVGNPSAVGQALAACFFGDEITEVPSHFRPEVPLSRFADIFIHEEYDCETKVFERYSLNTL